MSTHNIQIQDKRSRIIPKKLIPAVMENISRDSRANLEKPWQTSHQCSNHRSFSVYVIYIIFILLE